MAIKVISEMDLTSKYFPFHPKTTKIIQLSEKYKNLSIMPLAPIQSNQIYKLKKSRMKDFIWTKTQDTC